MRSFFWETLITGVVLILFTAIMLPLALIVLLSGPP